MRLFLPLLLIPFLVSCQNAPTDYQSFKDAQDYTVPLWNKDHGAARQVALFIFPHPDDEIVCGGTIAILKQQGWEVNLLTLTQGNAGEKETRKAEWINAVHALGINKYDMLDLPNNTWNDIQKDKLIFWNEQMDSIRHIIYNEIAKYSPSLLFTYDEVMGGYGHPEHRLTAQAAREVFQQHIKDPSFSPKAIFQITLPEKLETKILGSLDSYKKAVKSLGKTLPDPTIAFDITNSWATKREAALTYTSQVKTLKKFYLVPDEANTTMHYSTFNREYYTEIKR